MIKKIIRAIADGGRRWCYAAEQLFRMAADVHTALVEMTIDNT